MSKIANEVYDTLKDVFSLNVIKKEYYVNYRNTRLFFDFYIKDLGVLIEIQGRQHTEFIKHFHGDKEKFLSQKKRDNLKIDYVQENKKFCLVRFKFNEKITNDLVRNKIYNALNEEEGFYE